MAAQKIKSTNAVVTVMAFFASVYFFASRNYRSETSGEGKLKELRHSMAGSGWWRSHAIPCERIADVHTREGKPGEMAKCGPHAGALVPDFAADCLALRQAEWDALKIDQTTEGKQKLAVFEQLFTTNGKLIKPEYMAIACFQRGSQYFASQVERFKGDGVNPGLEPYLEVPLEVLSISTEIDRLEKQVLENEGKMIGNQPTSYRDKLRTGQKFFQLGKNQNYFRNLYSSTTGQKLHGLLRLDSLWPNLKIVNRVLMEKPSDPAAAEMSEYIPYEKVMVPDLTALIRRSPAAKEKLNPGESHVAEIDVDRWFRDLKRTAGNAEKVMGKDVMKGIGDQNPVQVIKDIMQGVQQNNTDYINKYVPLAAGLNVLTELAAAGHYPLVELVLVVAGENMRSNPTQPVLHAFRDAVDKAIASTMKPATQPEQQ